MQLFVPMRVHRSPTRRPLLTAALVSAVLAAFVEGPLDLDASAPVARTLAAPVPDSVGRVR